MRKGKSMHVHICQKWKYNYFFICTAKGNKSIFQEPASHYTKSSLQSEGQQWQKSHLVGTPSLRIKKEILRRKKTVTRFPENLNKISINWYTLLLLVVGESVANLEKNFSSFEGNFSIGILLTWFQDWFLFNNLFRCLASSAGKTICGKFPSPSIFILVKGQYWLKSCQKCAQFGWS